MNYFKYLISVSVFTLLVSFVSFHHGWADYNQEKVLDFKTVIEESVYENPHALAKVKFQEKLWTVYLAPTSRMTDRGLTAEMIKPGSQVRLVAYPHKTKKNEMRAERIFVDGKKYELR